MLLAALGLGSLPKQHCKGSSGHSAQEVWGARVTAATTHGMNAAIPPFIYKKTFPPGTGTSGAGMLPTACTRAWGQLLGDSSGGAGPGRTRRGSPRHPRALPCTQLLAPAASGRSLEPSPPDGEQEPSVCLLPAGSGRFPRLTAGSPGWFGRHCGSRGGGERLPAAGTHQAFVSASAAGQGTCWGGGPPRQHGQGVTRNRLRP